MDNIKQYREYLKADFREEEFSTSDEKKGISEPSFQKAYPDDAKIIDLVAPDKLICFEDNFLTLLRKRKTRRSYANKELSIEELSYLLWSIQGIKKISPTKFGTLRTTPSASGRHSFETYIAVFNVGGLEKGIYRYLPLNHKLVFVKEIENIEEKISEVCLNQKFIAKSAVTFIWTTIPYRVEWRYHIQSFKMITLEAGHMAQNLYMAAESANAGMCAIGGYNQKKIDQLLGVDGIDEFVIYVASVGKQN